MFTSEPYVHRFALWVLRCVTSLRGPVTRDAGPLRVCWFVAHAWGTGGTIRTTVETADALSREYDVSVLSLLRRSGRAGIRLPAAVRVASVEDQRAGHQRRRGVLGRPSLLIDNSDGLRRHCTLLTALRPLRALWTLDADVLIATRPSLVAVAAAGARRGCRVVGAEHLNLDTRSGRTQASLRRAARYLDAVVTLTDADREAYARLLAGRQITIVTIPNAVPETDPPPPRSPELVILAAGRLTPQKGFTRLVDAFALVADAHPQWALRICGDGRQMRALRRRVARHGLQARVTLPGVCQDMSGEYARAGLLATTSRFEGLPMVLLEAMSAGVPAVAMDCPTGPAELIEDGVNGRLTAPDDVRAFAAALSELLGDEPQRDRLGAAARRVAETHARDVVAERWRAFLGH